MGQRRADVKLVVMGPSLFRSRGHPELDLSAAPRPRVPPGADRLSVVFRNSDQSTNRV